MGWVSGTVVFLIIWWTVLFAVLPLGVQPDPEAQAQSGWRGAPREVRFARILLITTLVSVLLWFVADWIIRSDWLSFRSGWWAMPSD
ncbi:DUF1467 family protein [Muricoccus radiodurans]|uniref:DUF1467 family protein n=1 Tax=Muricoccus radiodurans TaxID=2231721 RepID=UPI003CEC349D